MQIVYHVAARLSAGDSARLGSPHKRLHATLAYSRAWFPYKPGKAYPLLLNPPFRMDEFHGVPVLRFEDPAFTARHRELREAGAEWDFPGFASHISVPVPLSRADLRSLGGLALEHEYYMTWRET